MVVKTTSFFFCLKYAFNGLLTTIKEWLSYINNNGLLIDVIVALTLFYTLICTAFMHLTVSPRRWVREKSPRLKAQITEDSDDI